MTATESTSPAALSGAGAPKAAIDTAKMTTTEASAMHQLDDGLGGEHPGRWHRGG